MSVHFTTNKASALLQAFNQAIEKGHSTQGVTTWRHLVQNGKNYYTHTAQNWKEKAWFMAVIENSQLTFVICPSKDVTLTRLNYAYYSGHLVETFTRHFPSIFNLAQITPNPAQGDSSF